MLNEISIKNFAIIDDLNITFSQGLTILSGETGAGKSIIINAVNLLLGTRATAKLIRTGAKTAELEAQFHVFAQSSIAKIMEKHGYEPSEGLIIRRIIASNDRHKIYINGSLATISILTSITQNLASISGQHAHQGLLKEEQHLLILDLYGGLTKKREKVAGYFHKMIPLLRRLKELQKRQEQKDDQRELLEFQKMEILDAAIMPKEDEELKQEKHRLKNAEMLIHTVSTCLETLYDGSGSIFEKMSEIGKVLGKAALVDNLLISKAENVSDLSFRVEDITEELRHFIKQVQVDENRLEEIETRIDLLNRLKRKYGDSLETIALYLEKIEKELSGIENLSKSINETETQLLAIHGKIKNLSVELSKQRNKAATKLAKKVEKELADLKMPGTKFLVSLESIPMDPKADPHLSFDNKALSDTGYDHARFLIAPNIGEDAKPLAGVASGGELSRIVLALKAILAETDSVETVVFDEVDAGIGGGVAEVVGKKLVALSKIHQIICITHLPQIAKFGGNHYKISKSVVKGRTTTKIEPLAKKGRIDELARMLGGEEITRATLDHAKEMLQRSNTA